MNNPPVTTASPARANPTRLDSARRGRRYRPGAEVLEGRQLLAVAIGEAAIPTPSSAYAEPWGSICAGPDGNVWFIGSSNTVGRITPDGTITEFAVGGDRGLRAITAGPDGN